MPDEDAMRVRRAVLGDEQAVAEVHVATWQTAYRGLLPDEVIARRTIAQRTASWHGVLEDTASETHLYVAETGAPPCVVGFAACGRARDPLHDHDYSGEVYSIYVLDAAQGQGIGTALMRACAIDLLGRGHPSMIVWVLVGNTHAERFYARLGGQMVGVKSIDMGGTRMLERGYAWRDIRVLIDAS
jgi:GNAT superfamily N-acetyltransferase